LLVVCFLVVFLEGVGVRVSLEVLNSKEKADRMNNKKWFFIVMSFVHEKVYAPSIGISTVDMFYLTRMIR
jgi:hypothetical protein